MTTLTLLIEFPIFLIVSRPTKIIIEDFVAPITPGRILFEAEGVSLATAKEAMRLAANKLPVATKFVVRRDYVEE